MVANFCDVAHPADTETLPPVTRLLARLLTPGETGNMNQQPTAHRWVTPLAKYYQGFSPDTNIPPSESDIQRLGQQEQTGQDITAAS